MFTTGSPYSPFFTSGLLSLSQPPLPVRRGSLPTDATTSTSSTIEEGASAFYFTLQPKRDTSEYRSFLSLDLAESRSLASASIKRKPSQLLSPLSASETPFTSHPTMPRVPSGQLAPPHSPLRLRRSRDSLRSIPSPKPAPSITLPDLPSRAVSPFSISSAVISAAPPRLPSIAIGTSLGLTIDRASHSAPSLIISSYEPLATVTKMPKRNSASTVSTSIRRVNRSQALARLEGRTNSTMRRKAMNRPIARNFMNMSDDDDDQADDEELEVENNGVKVTLSAILEPEDIVLPPRSPPRLTASKSAPIGGRFPSLSTASSPKNKQQRNKPKDWFPLKSFIDLQGEEEMSRWSWRSFIEVASVS